jgi:hypothetical protein
MALATTWLIAGLALWPAVYRYSGFSRDFGVPVGPLLLAALTTAAMVGLLLTIVVAAPLWLIAHLRRATRRAATGLAAIIVAVGSLSTATKLGVPDQEMWLIAIGGATAAAAAAFMIWTVAYPRSLQPPEPAEVF